MGLTDEQIIPVKMDATALKYEKEFFDHTAALRNDDR